jgi:hypothetical protein
VALPATDFDLLIRAIQLAAADDSSPLRIVAATPQLIDNRPRDHDDRPITISRATFVLRSDPLDSLLLDEFTMEMKLRVRDRLVGMKYGTLVDAHATVVRSDLSWRSKTRMWLIGHEARSSMREFVNRVSRELALDAAHPRMGERKVPNLGMVFAYSYDIPGAATANPAWQKTCKPQPYPGVVAHNPAFARSVVV